MLTPSPFRHARAAVDALMVGGLPAGATRTIEITGGRLGWWRMRHRLRARYGVTATRLAGSTWTLRGTARTAALSSPAPSSTGRMARHRRHKTPPG